jgi:hypothetical protein
MPEIQFYYPVYIWFYVTSVQKKYDPEIRDAHFAAILLKNWN